MSWPLVSLPTICRPKQWPTIPKSKLFSSGYPVFGANGKIGYYSEYNHEDPTILITCRGATCGTINVCEPKSYVTGNAMALDDLDGAKADLKFLVHALDSADFSGVITGVAQPQITRQSLARLEIPLPPLAEQKRIAGILDAADALRAKRRESLAQLDTLLQSTFLDMFGDPVTNPMGWEVRELAEVVKTGTIVTYGIVQAGDEYSGGVPYIRTGDLLDGEIQLEGLRHTDPAIAAKFERSRVYAGEIVMSIRATVGTTAQVPRLLDGANLTQGTARISPGEETVPSFLLYFIRSQGSQTWLQRQVKGATFKEITLKRLRQMPIHIPPLDLQRRFAAIVGSVEQQKAIQRAHLEELDTLFASLQSRAFRGDL